MPTWIFRRASGGCVGWMSGFAPVSAGFIAGSFAVVAVLRVVGRIGGDGSGRQSGGPREISKKSANGGAWLGLTRVHGRYRARTGWNPGIGLGGMPPCLSHATAAMPPTRYLAGARRSDEPASSTAFLNAGAVTSCMSRPLDNGRRECTREAGGRGRRLTNARTTGVRHSPPRIRARREITGASTKGEGGASTGHRAGS